MWAIWDGYVGDLSSREARWAIWASYVDDLRSLDICGRFEPDYVGVWAHESYVGDLS